MIPTSRIFAKLYDFLLDMSYHPDVQEDIKLFRDMTEFAIDPDGKFPPVLMYSFTHIGNVAELSGEFYVAMWSRQIRDDLRKYCK